MFKKRKNLAVILSLALILGLTPGDSIRVNAAEIAAVSEDTVSGETLGTENNVPDEGKESVGETGSDETGDEITDPSETVSNNVDSQNTEGSDDADAEKNESAEGEEIKVDTENDESGKEESEGEIIDDTSGNDAEVNENVGSDDVESAKDEEGKIIGDVLGNTTEVGGVALQDSNSVKTEEGSSKRTLASKAPKTLKGSKANPVVEVTDTDVKESDEESKDVTDVKVSFGAYQFNVVNDGFPFSLYFIRFALSLHHIYITL
jgi:hypothetical protein